MTLENVIITPHIGGATFEAALLGVEILAGQLEQYLEHLHIAVRLRQREGAALSAYLRQNAVPAEGGSR